MCTVTWLLISTNLVVLCSGVSPVCKQDGRNIQMPIRGSIHETCPSLQQHQNSSKRKDNTHALQLMMSCMYVQGKSCLCIAGLQGTVTNKSLLLPSMSYLKHVNHCFRKGGKSSCVTYIAICFRDAGSFSQQCLHNVDMTPVAGRHQGI